MRVLIDTTFERRSPRSGTAVYLRALRAGLAELGVEVLAVANQRRRAPAGGGLGSGRNLADDLCWTAVELPRLARRLRADLIHHPLPALAPRAPVPQVVTVMDLAFERLPQCFDRGFRSWARLTHRLAARRAAAVVCISHTTAADAQELWGLPASRIVVAPLGPGQVEGRRPPAAIREHLLYVGDAEPRKAVPVLLEAYRRYRARAAAPLALVLAGGAGAALPGAAPGDGIEVLPAPGAAQLVELLGKAVALVAPSLYEGFGLAPLEAMALGTPVLAARSPGTIEVCGEAALYAAPGDAEELARGMLRLHRDLRLREELGRRGAQRAEQFSWARCARRHTEAYSLALGPG